MHVSSISDLSQAVAEFVAANYPGRSAVRVQILMNVGKPFAADVVAPAPVARADVRDTMSQLERRVFDVLSPRKGLTVAAISTKLDDYDQSTLHRRGIKPLVQKGLVIHDEDAGGFILADSE